MYAIGPPSGDHAGECPLIPRSVSARVWTFNTLRDCSLVKTILVPSGDQLGKVSFTSGVFVRFT